MGADTRIEWADHTFNPWIGCTAVSPACDHCYAETLATARLGVGWGPHAERRRTQPSTWNMPLRWNRQAERENRRFRVFTASLADVFDNAVPEEWRRDLWTLIAKTRHLDWLLLTKRPSNIAKMLPLDNDTTNHIRRFVGIENWPWPHVWLGTTVENQAEADRRIPHLLAVPAARRFLSCEPLLGPVDLNLVAPTFLDGEMTSFVQALPDPRYPAPYKHYISWIIAGGESGPKARPSHPDWFRSLRDQCQAAGVPFFFKQWGEYVPVGPVDRGSATDPHEYAWERVGKKAAGAMLDGREWREIPQ